jgi:hypothetical protein
MAEAARPDFDIEGLLRQALSPVEPPERLSERLERTLSSITDAAAEELDAWEISAMRDPRNWVRPAVAVSAGTVAGVGLVVLRARAKGKKRRDQASDPLDFAEQILRDLADEARKLLDRDD